MYSRLSFFLFSVLLFVSCAGNEKDANREALLEVEGRFLYRDQIEAIVPTNVSDADSLKMAEAYIRKWATDVLLYENAKRNIGDKSEIDALLEQYRKALTIHQYQQRLIQQRLPKIVSEDEILSFYEQYGSQFVLHEHVLKGLLLVVPAGTNELSKVRSWVRSGDAKAVEEIEKFSMKGALSYHYFYDYWMTFSELQKRMPLQADRLTTTGLIEYSDSARHYLLHVRELRKEGQTEPFETASGRISEIILNKLKSDFVSRFEDELYNDAVRSGTITFFNE
jgi:hypothetical protein